MLLKGCVLKFHDEKDDEISPMFENTKGNPQVHQIACACDEETFLFHYDVSSEFPYENYRFCLKLTYLFFAFDYKINYHYRF